MNNFDNIIPSCVAENVLEFLFDHSLTVAEVTDIGSRNIGWCFNAQSTTEAKVAASPLTHLTYTQAVKVFANCKDFFFREGKD